MKNSIRDRLFDRTNFEAHSKTAKGTAQFGLDTMRLLVQELGNPHLAFPVVHLAGTKGKGSTALMIAQILRASGLRVGLYTSPHLYELEERYWIDGSQIDSTELDSQIAIALQAATRLRNRVQKGEPWPASDATKAGSSGKTAKPTFFELTTAIAFLAFQNQKVDVGVIETGLGGRLDSTNVCDPCLTLITNIDLDHTHILGDTVEQIAAEKAGIIKPKVPVICGITQPSAQQVARQIALQQEAPFLQMEEDFGLEFENSQSSFADSTAADSTAADSVAADSVAADSVAADLRPADSKTAAPKTKASSSYAAMSGSSELPDSLTPPNPLAMQTNQKSPFAVWYRTAQPMNDNPSTQRILGLDVAMPGRHQQLNAALAVAASVKLRERGWMISDEAIRRGLKESRSPVRIEFDERIPDLVYDMAHNLASLTALVETLDELRPAQPRTLLFAVSKDKDRSPMLDLIIQSFDQVIVSKFVDNPRATPAKTLWSELHQKLILCQSQDIPHRLKSEQLELAEVPASAVQQGISKRHPGQLVVIAGSIFFAAEMKRLLAESDCERLVP